MIFFCWVLLVANNRLNSRKFEQKINLLMGAVDTIVLSQMPPNSFYCMCVSHTQTLQNWFVRLPPAQSSDGCPRAPLAALPTCTEMEAPAMRCGRPAHKGD